MGALSPNRRGVNRTRGAEPGARHSNAGVNAGVKSLLCRPGEVSHTQDSFRSYAQRSLYLALRIYGQDSGALFRHHSSPAADLSLLAVEKRGLEKGESMTNASE